MISVVVFAHNEEANVARCIESVLKQDDLTTSDRITVLENGSTDGTARRVEDMSARDSRVGLVRIPLGDKANAWDFYVFRTSVEIDGDLHIFIDGDVIMRSGTLISMRRTMDAHPKAMALAGLPYGGRQAEAWRHRILKHHGLPGNLYALTATTLKALRTENWCLPVGYIGDDTFLLWLLKRRLNARSAPDRSAIVPAGDAGFEYESIPYGSGSGLRRLYRRQRVYGMRDIQTRLLIDYLKADIGNRPPREIVTLYPGAVPTDALFAPFGKLRPFKIRKLLFWNTWKNTRDPLRRLGKAWYET